mmetsp:Transcript_51601/g.167589  ORF Transcript_51601/g.167589 Transcript_51601/m.167589 type:complete len:340 (+) Transcript_51601:193-1212(+)
MGGSKPQPHRLASGASASQPIFGSGGGSRGDLDDASQEHGMSSLRPGRAAMLGQNASSAPGNPSASVGLYASPSFSSMYTEPEDLEPGPGSYDVPQSFGYQHLSTHHSQPCVSLTAKHDKSWAKVMITKDHLSSLMARGTPGPGSYVPELVPTQARVRFGTGKRRSLSDSQIRAPGPVYDLPCSVEPPKSVKFGKANRFDSDNQSLSRLLGSTGPGQYEVSGSFDGQHLSKSFGTSHRAYDHVRFPGSDRVGVGRNSPGPGSLQPFQNSGKANGFGRAERLPGDLSGKRAPGPGAYDSHEKNPPSSRNQSCYSFGRPPARGRVDWKQMQHHTNSCWGVR